MGKRKVLITQLDYLFNKSTVMVSDEVFFSLKREKNVAQRQGCLLILNLQGERLSFVLLRNSI